MSCVLACIEYGAKSLHNLINSPRHHYIRWMLAQTLNLGKFITHAYFVLFALYVLGSGPFTIMTKSSNDYMVSGTYKLLLIGTE